MCGYCAIGSVNTAIDPASVMTIDSTEAKIGRSMKKREIIGQQMGNSEWGMWNDEVNDTNDEPNSGFCPFEHSPFLTPHFTGRLPV